MLTAWVFFLFSSADAHCDCHNTPLFQSKAFEKPTFCNADFFVLLLIDSRPISTVNFKTCLKGLQAAKSDYNLFGHVWILLVDQRANKYWECGYTGETSSSLPGYFDGLGQLLQGQMSPEMKRCGADLQNPVGYLFLKRNDGRLQWGNGGHTPTCALGIALSQSQKEKIIEQILNCTKNEYSLQNDNCIHFALSLLRIADVRLRCFSKRLLIPKTITIDHHRVLLRRDSAFKTLALCTPQLLSSGLKRRYKLKEMKAALLWYMTHFKTFCNQSIDCRQRLPWREVHCRQEQQRP